MYIMFPNKEISTKKYAQLQPFTKWKRKGVAIEKKNIPNNILLQLKADLTLEPKVNKSYVKNIPKIPVYHENKKIVSLPPYWCLDNIGKPAKNFVKDGQNFTNELKTIYPPRDYQEPIVDKTLKQLKKIKGAFITIGCGGGKTFLAIYLATLLKQRTLIIVHTSVLLDQWIERINYFVPEAKIGKIKGQIYDVEGKDFVICMLQTVVREDRGYTAKTFKDFGTVIVDEAHHIAAPSFSRALPIISTKYKIGLSATPERNDKLEKIFYWFLGPSSWYSRKRDNIYTMCKIVRYQEPKFTEKKNWQGNFDLVDMINQIIENKKRNKFIIKQAIHYAKMGRQTLVLSTRRSHLEDLKEMFDKKKVVKNNGFLATTGMYVGGMKQKAECPLKRAKKSVINKIIEKNIDKVKDEKYLKLLFKNGIRRTDKDGNIKIFGTKKIKIEMIKEYNMEHNIKKKASLDESAKADVLFATYQLVSEGTDIPTLNTLIMGSPKKEVEQVVGRIQRAKNEHKPLVVDICDMFSVYINQGRHRERFYNKQEYYVDETIYDATEKKIPIIKDVEKKNNKKTIIDCFDSKPKHTDIVTFDKCML